MKTITKIVVFAFLLLSACNLFRGKTADQMFNPKTIDLPQGGSQVIDGINNLGFNVLKKIADSLSEENNMISPFSLATVLTMLQQGAENNTLSELNNLLNINGLTKQQIAQVYKTIIEQIPQIDEKVQLFPANSIWIKNNFTVNTDYKSLTKKYFLADIFTEPFDNSTVKKINDWVIDKTNGKIDKITDDLNDDVMVLINALYFYGQWLDKFNEQNTTNRIFHLDSSNNILVPTMADEIDHVGFGWFDTVLVGELFYGQGNFSMIVVVPQNTYNISNFIQNIDMQTWNNWLSNLTTKNIDVNLPKFSFTSNYCQLTRILHTLGLDNALSSNADFSDINPSLYLSQIIQKTYIKVNEQGTEAAAVSGAFMGATAAPEFLTVDRPFLFAIRETTTGLILFMGVVNNPAE